jgi:hypothetical protein
MSAETVLTCLASLYKLELPGGAADIRLIDQPGLTQRSIESRIVAEMRFPPQSC